MKFRTVRVSGSAARMAALVAALVGAAAVVTLPGRVASADTPQNNVLARALAIQRGQVQPTKFEMPLSAGVMNALIQSYEARRLQRPWRA